MREIIFVTGNKHKLQNAVAVLEPLGITLVQRKLDIPEFQIEKHQTGEVIARDKAQKAYDIVRRPVAVTDDTWHISALNGFPGAYMKHINSYFTPDDFLRLMQPFTDDERKIYLQQHLVYQDEHGQQHFVATLPGVLLSEAKGHLQNEPSSSVISITPDRKSLAELFDEGKSAIALSGQRSPWHMLGEWLQNTK